MRRRSFLVTCLAGGIVGSSGCLSAGSYRVVDIDGLADSNVFEDVQWSDDTRELKVTVTREATLEHGVDEVRSVVRGDPDVKWDLEPGETEASIVVQDDDGAFPVNIVAYGPNGQPVDDIEVTLRAAD